jgi:hypothetical protein
MFVPRFVVFFAPFVAYSFGVAFCRRVLFRAAVVSPHPLEALAVLFSAFVMAAMRPADRVMTYVAVLAFFAFFTGITSGRLFLPPERIAGTREFEEEHQEPTISIWKRWIALAHTAADFQIRLILAACYALLIGPIAVLFRLTRPNEGAPSTTWITRAKSDSTIGSARKSF